MLDRWCVVHRVLVSQYGMVVELQQVDEMGCWLSVGAVRHALAGALPWPLRLCGACRTMCLRRRLGGLFALGAVRVGDDVYTKFTVGRGRHGVSQHCVGWEG